MNIYNILRIYYPALLVFFTVFIFTIFSFYQIRKSTTERRAKLFEIRTHLATETISQRITDYIQILKGCQALFYSSDSVTSEDWKIYTDNLKLSSNYPGMQGIAFAKFIRKNEKADLEHRMRKSFSYFSIKSSLANDYMAPIIYIEPKDQRNLKAFGYDMYSEKKRREAMEQALVTGEASLTKKVTLVQEIDKNVQPGFLLYLPVYRDPARANTPEKRKSTIEGFVYNPFRAHDLMNAVLGGFSDIQIEIYDQNKSSVQNLLYKSDTQEPPHVKGEFNADTSISIAGAQWILSFSSGSDFGSSIERKQPLLVLIFGFAMSCMLLIITYNFINRRQAAIEELNISKELERKKDEFIGIASHELKTPLTSLKAYLQMLDRAELSEREKNFVVKANLQINKLNNLISDLLDVSKIQAGGLKLNIAPFKLGELINESVISVMHLYGSQQIITPSIVPDITIKGDKFRLEQSLINILVNAIKYSPGAEKVYLDTRIKDGSVIIEVRDEGIGISQENQEKIFEKFYRPEELSPVFSGLGMGLYISRELICRHGGTITVKSELGKGSTFKIALPIEATTK